LLRHVAHWLMQEPELEEERLAGQVSGGRLRVDKTSLSDETLPVLVTDPDERQTEVAMTETRPGLHQGSLPLSGMGLYRLTSGPLTAMVAIGALNPLEAKDVRSTDKKAAGLADRTGGGIRRLSDGGVPDFLRTSPTGNQASKMWLGLRDNRNYEITGYSQIPLSPPVIALLLLMAAAGLSWWREGR
jgi:hypothetical protein